MNAKFFIVFCLAWAPLIAAPASRESVAIQEFRSTLEQFKEKMQHCKTDMELFQERLQTQERTLQELQGDAEAGKGDKLYEKRLVSLEKNQEAIASDLKTLKTHLNDHLAQLAACQTKIAQIDQQLSSDIKSLKQSLSSMLALLKKEEGPEKTYVVRPGDSLGQIALNNRTDIKTLKNLNSLKTTTIYPGQKIILP